MRRVYGMQTVVSCFAIAVIAVEPTGKESLLCLQLRADEASFMC